MKGVAEEAAKILNDLLVLVVPRCDSLSVGRPSITHSLTDVLISHSICLSRRNE